MKRLAAAFALCLLAGTAIAQERFPAKPIQLVIPLAAGTSADVVFRPIAERLSQKLGQPVVLNHRPGASGTIAADLVAANPWTNYGTDLHSTRTTTVGNRWRWRR